MLRKILVPVRGDGMAETVIAHAAALAQHHTAHITVVHCRPQPEDMMPYGIPLPAFARKTMLEQARELADQQEQEVRAQLHRIVEALPLTETDTPIPGAASFQFIEEFGRMADVIKHNGRLADIIVVSKPDRDRNLGTNSLKSGIFRSGRPVLMCPQDRPIAPDLCAHMVIAWNGSLESSRAVALTLDLAGAAERVTILAGGKGEQHSASSDELADYYGLRGIQTQIHRFEAQNPGAALLEKTTELSGGFLVMGAYGHTHERETLFGGNTQDVVDKAEIPVVLVH